MSKTRYFVYMLRSMVIALILLLFVIRTDWSPLLMCLAVAGGDASSERAAEQENWPAAGAVLGAAVDEHAAMSFIFADYEAENGFAVWRPAETTALYLYFRKAYQSAQMHSAVAFSATYHEGGEDHFLVILQTAPPFSNCHACNVVLGAVIFVRQDRLWRLRGVHPAITRAGSNGRAPEEMSLVKIGPALHGVAIRQYYMAQGYTTEDFMLIGPVGEEWIELLYVADAGEDNQGICADNDNAFEQLALPRCWRYESEIRFLQGSNQFYFDIEVFTTGSYRGAHESVVSLQRQVVYSFVGGRYVKR